MASPCVNQLCQTGNEVIFITDSSGYDSHCPVPSSRPVPPRLVPLCPELCGLPYGEWQAKRVYKAKPIIVAQPIDQLVSQETITLPIAESRSQEAIIPSFSVWESMPSFQSVNLWMDNYYN